MIPVKVLAVKYLPNAPKALLAALETDCPCLAMLTTDCDDATYIALDEATKAARAEVVYARSFYAGAANATQPNAGEVIGVLGAYTPGDVRSAMEAALNCLQRVGFEEQNGVSFLAHTVSASGSFLSKEAGVPLGSALAYLIAPPLEQNESILLGEDLEPQIPGLCIVSDRYLVGGGLWGSIALIGPTRMPFQKLMPLLHAFADQLGEGMSGKRKDTPQAAVPRRTVIYKEDLE